MINLSINIVLMTDIVTLFFSMDIFNKTYAAQIILSIMKAMYNSVFTRQQLFFTPVGLFQYAICVRFSDWCTITTSVLLTNEKA